MNKQKTLNKIQEMSDRALVHRIKELKTKIPAYKELSGKVPYNMNSEYRLLGLELDRRIRVERNKKAVSKDVRPLTIRAKKMVAAIADYYKYTYDEIRDDSREHKLAYCRQVAMWFLRKYLYLSFLRIARAVNRKDHSTVFYGVQKIDGLLQEGNLQLSKEIREIEEIILKLDEEGSNE